jgi:ElaB/YqjD/DUF883 family membrane-anchored ribosome-binding protein
MATAKPEDMSAELSREMKALRDDLAALAGTVKEMAAQRAETIVENISETVKMTAAEAQERGEAMAGEIEAMIRNRPLTSVLVAAAIGYLAAKITR